MWPMGHPDTDEVGGHDRDILWAILGYDDLSLPSLRMDNGKSGCFGGIWARFLGLRGAPSTMGPTSRQVDFEGTAGFLTVLACHGYN